MLLEPWRSLVARLMAAWHRRRLDQDLEDEMAFHLAMREEQLQVGGLKPAEAEAAARRRFGNVLSVKEACRDLWTFPAIEQLAQHARYGLRRLRRAPGFTTVAVLSLALASGVTTAVFALLDATMLRKLPVPEPERLVVPHWTAEYASVQALMSLPGCGAPGNCEISYSFYEKVQSHAQPLVDLAACSNPVQIQVAVRGESALAQAQFVSGTFFSVLAVGSGQGRLLDRDDDRTGGNPVVVLSDGYWSERFSRAPVVGQTLAVNGTALTIVGVAPMGFHGLDPTMAPALWIPVRTAARLPSTSSMAVQTQMLLHEGAFVFGTVGRLKPGVTGEQARAALTTALRRATAENARPEVKVKSTGDVVLTSGA